MTQSNPTPPPRRTSLAAPDRARILLELLREQKTQGPAGPLLADARLAAGTDGTRVATPNADILRASARELLKRIGLKTQPPVPEMKGAMQGAVLRSTVAALVDGARLGDEHPAVIALVIERQSHATQTAVLRALPGRTARRVQRALGHLVAD